MRCRRRSSPSPNDYRLRRTSGAQAIREASYASPAGPRSDSRRPTSSHRPLLNGERCQGTGEVGFLVLIPAVALIFFPWVSSPFALKQDFAPLLFSAALLYWLNRDRGGPVR